MLVHLRHKGRDNARSVVAGQSTEQSCIFLASRYHVRSAHCTRDLPYQAAVDCPIIYEQELRDGGAQSASFSSKPNRRQCRTAAPGVDESVYDIGFA